LFQEPLTIILSDGGVITAHDVARLLFHQFGNLLKVRFNSSAISALVAPNAVAWEAVGDGGEMVQGALVLHAAVADDHVEVWAEVTVNRRGAPETRNASVDESRMLLEEIGKLGRDLIARIRREPAVSRLEVVAGIVKIVDLAEGNTSGVAA
jgi:hypothetical protein